MRVLVVTPVYRGQLYGRMVQRVFRQRWNSQLDYMFLCGGDDETIEKPLHERAVAYRNITRKYEYARQLAVAHGYDALFEVESDIIVPEDALEKLASVDADIVYGLYVWRHGMPLWSAYTTVHGKLGVSISQTPELARRMFGQVIDVAGIGDGCTLIRRSALEAITRWTTDDGYACADWHMAEDAQRLGLTQKAHLGVVCGHMVMKPSPRILWPDPNAERLYRVEFLEPPAELSVDPARNVVELTCNGMGVVGI